MSTQRGNRRIDTFPYRHARQQLEFTLERYALDNGSSTDLEDPREADLSNEQGWRNGTLKATIGVSDEILDTVFPDGEPNQGALVVTLYCPTNHYRSEFVVEESPLSAGSYTDGVDLDLGNLRGRIELTPLLLRSERLQSQPSGLRGPPYAERPGRKLAHGPRASLFVDEPISGRSKDLPTMPTKFSESNFPADEGNMWYLDLRNAAEPKLHINKDHGFVVPLLQHVGQDGRGRLRRLVLNLLGTQVMTQFVLEAAELYVVHGEYRYSWQEKMLTDVCGDLFGDKTPAEVEEMIEPGTLSDTLNQIAVAMERRRAPHEALERVLELNL